MTTNLKSKGDNEYIKKVNEQLKKVKDKLLIEQENAKQSDKYVGDLMERIDDRNETITNLHKDMWANANEIGDLKAIIKYLEQKIDFLSVSTKGE